jgi:ATP-binding cassette subfamily F protein uup
LSASELRELDGLFDAIEAAEVRVVEIQSLLADPEIYQGAGERAASLRDDLEVAEAEAFQLTARWEELEERKSDSGASS